MAPGGAIRTPELPSQLLHRIARGMDDVSAHVHVTLVHFLMFLSGDGCALFGGGTRLGVTLVPAPTAPFLVNFPQVTGITLSQNVVSRVWLNSS